MKSHLKIIILIALSGCLLMLPSGCKKSDPRYRIGVAQCSDDEWRSRMNEEIRREMLFHDDAEVEIRSADDRNEKQIEDINYFIDNDFDLIITAPNEADAITPVIRKAHEKGIPVIIFDRNINGDSYTSYIELDNEGIGRAAAEYATHLAAGRPVRILEVRGLDGSTPAGERHRGFISEIARHDNISLAASVSGAWNGEKARLLVDSLLRRDANIDIIYAHNDVMAIAAAESARALGLNDIKILGTDAAPSLGIKAVRDSVIDATFIYPTEGGRVIRTAMAILKGEDFPRHDHIPALSPVDTTNAEILIRQDALLRDETTKIELLRSKNLMITARQQMQSYFLYAVGVAAILLMAGLMLTLWFMRQRKRLNMALAQKNEELSNERDHQDELYRQLDEATNSKLAFFTNVSHDLRTPLTLIAGPLAQLAKADYLKQEDKSLMKIANKNVEILRRLIDQILDFRRYQNGKTELHLEESDPIPLLSEWCDAFRDVAQNLKLKYSLNISPSDGKTMALDAEKLERVIFNLISNAFKYTSKGGCVGVEARLSDKELHISISDTGIGIPEKEREQIFDRFYQVNRVNANGSGIGLSLAKAFVELMGGEITLESEAGKGSIFHVTIPVHHVENKCALPTIYHDPNKWHFKEFDIDADDVFEFSESKALILVIDDNPDIRHLLSGLLGAEYNIISAPDGRAGLRLALKYVPDLVICDIMMPVMDGLEFCSSVKEERSTSHIPVLMLTACKLDEQRMQSYDSGADGFISKPFNTNLLISRVHNLLLNRKRIKNVLLDNDNVEFEKNGAPLPDDNERVKIESEFYRKFLYEVKERYTDSSLSVSEIASGLGLGATQLARKIKALTGLSPVDIIRDYRLREARRLVLVTEKNVSEIAYEVGFSSPPYLSKCFRDAFGESPTELRTRLKPTN